MRIQYLKEGSLTPPAFLCDAWPLEEDYVKHIWDDGNQSVEGRVVNVEWLSETVNPQPNDALPSFFGPMTKVTIQITIEDDDGFAF